LNCSYVDEISLLIMPDRKMMYRHVCQTQASDYSNSLQIKIHSVALLIVIEVHTVKKMLDLCLGN